MSQQPIPGTRPAEKSGVGAGRSAVPYLALHPMGFSVPPRSRLERWALTPPFHPYPTPPETNRHRRARSSARTGSQSALRRCSADGFRKGWAVCFLWHFPSPTPLGIASRVYPPSQPSCEGACGLRGIAPYGARTFLPRLAPGAILRPSKISGNISRRVSDVECRVSSAECRVPRGECRGSSAEGRHFVPSTLATRHSIQSTIAKSISAV